MIVEINVEDTAIRRRNRLLEQWSEFKNHRLPVIVFMDSPFYCQLSAISIESIYACPERMITAQLMGWKRLLETVCCDNVGPSVAIDFGSCFTGSMYGCDIAYQPNSVPTTHPWFTSEDDIGRLEKIDPFSQGLAEREKQYYDIIRKLSSDYPIRYAGGDQCCYPLEKVSLMTGSEGPFSIVCMIAGLEQVSMWCYEKPELLLQMMAIITDKEIERIKKSFDYMGKPLDSVFLADDYSPYMPLDIYSEFIFPFQKKLCESFPGPPLFHSCIPEKRFLKTWKDELHIHLFNGFKPQNGLCNIKRDFTPVANAMCGQVLLEPDLDGANIMIADRNTLGEAAQDCLDVFQDCRGVKLCYTLCGGHSVDDLEKCNVIKQKISAR